MILKPKHVKDLAICLYQFGQKLNKIVNTDNFFQLESYLCLPISNGLGDISLGENLLTETEARDFLSEDQKNAIPALGLLKFLNTEKTLLEVRFIPIAYIVDKQLNIEVNYLTSSDFRKEDLYLFYENENIQIFIDLCDLINTMVGDLPFYLDYEKTQEINYIFNMESSYDGEYITPTRLFEDDIEEDEDDEWHW